MTATPRRPTSICILSTEGSTGFYEARLDEEIAGLAQAYSPLCVAIDAPLSYPSGAWGRGYRLCDREVRRLGIRIFPVSLLSMRLLAERGMRLAALLREMGFKVIETFPSGAQRILCIWRSGQRKAAPIASGLRRLGLRLPRSPSLDMVDAATCAYVALLHYKGMCLALGDQSEGLLYLPAKSTRLSAPRRSSCRSKRSNIVSRPS
ncbi:hypothetical protein HRbin02_01209 [Candidatus Calditenuaceae archaeon HR02]|nr:hypothetical protein HRbin02_01209 [Candidatus Calditenuaceae archaeon HR02]